MEEKDYRELAHKELDNITDVNVLKFIYIFIHDLQKEEVER